jgi:hypothetical protein
MQLPSILAGASSSKLQHILLLRRSFHIATQVPGAKDTTYPPPAPRSRFEPPAHHIRGQPRGSSAHSRSRQFIEPRNSVVIGAEGVIRRLTCTTGTAIANSILCAELLKFAGRIQQAPMIAGSQRRSSFNAGEFSSPRMADYAFGSNPTYELYRSGRRRSVGRGWNRFRGRALAADRGQPDQGCRVECPCPLLRHGKSDRIDLTAVRDAEARNRKATARLDPGLSYRDLNRAYCCAHP